MDRYHVLHLIGQGMFGKVFKGRRRYTGQVVALKFICKRGKSDKDIQNLRLELGILQRLDHPNIIRLLDSFETGSDFVVVTEFAYGELFEIFQDDKTLPTELVKDITRQLVQALYYLHSQKIVHRDMKPQNVLIGPNNTVKLCDFGFARVMSCHTTVLHSIKGSPLYMAPELMKERPYDYRADLWSLGVICYELVVGAPPFYADSIVSLMHIVVQKPVVYPEQMPQVLKSFLQALLQKDPRQRIAWPDLLYHPFIAEHPGSPVSDKTDNGRGYTAPEKTVEAAGARRASAAPASKQPQDDLHAGAPAPGGAPASEGGSVKHFTVMNKWLHVFQESVGVGAADKTQAAGSPDDEFGRASLALLREYAGCLERGLLLTANSLQVERDGLTLCLTGEPLQQDGGLVLPLAVLVRTLAQLLGQSQQGTSACVGRLLAADAMGQDLLSMMRSLCGRKAGPVPPGTGSLKAPPPVLLSSHWDVLSDLVRLLGLWTRAPIALGLGSLWEELLQPAGVLVQYLELAPVLVVAGVSGHFDVHNSAWGGSSGLFHLGTAVNSVKCLGVVFAHLAQAVTSQPPSQFATDLFQSLADAGNIRSSRDAGMQQLRALAMAIQVVCQSIFYRGGPGGAADKLVRPALQAAAALVYPSAAGDIGVQNGRQETDLTRLRVALGGAREVLREALCNALADVVLLAPGRSEVDDAVLAHLWELRTTAGGERLDASALKVLCALVQLSPELARRLARQPGVAESLAPDLAVGPGAALAILEATCAGAADQSPSIAWPSLGILLSILITSLKPWETSGSASKAAPDLELAGTPGLPPWCSVPVLQALSTRLQAVLSRPMESPLSILSACYGLELAATMSGALLRQLESAQNAALQQDLRRCFATVLQPVLEVVLNVVLENKVPRQCVEELRRAEGAQQSDARRGLLDGVIACLMVWQKMEDVQEASSWRLLRGFASRDDPRPLLTLLGPRGLLQLVDFVHASRTSLAAVEPPAAALRFALRLLEALRASTRLPSTGVVSLPKHVAESFRAALEVVQTAFDPFSKLAVPQGSPEVHQDFLDCKTVPTVLRFLAPLSCRDQCAIQAMDEVAWRGLSAGTQFLSTLVLHHPALAHEFVQQDGPQMFTERRLLSAALVKAEMAWRGAADIVVDALLIISQLARLSKDYYPLLLRLDVCPDVRDLLACGSANVRAKACNAVGNMARYSGAFYDAFRGSGLLANLVQCCSDEDSACRKFAAFAVGNAAFHSDMLYGDLSPSIPRLQRLLADEDEKTRANAAGAIGNLVRNSSQLCSAIIRDGALCGLVSLVSSRLPLHSPARDAAARDAANMESFMADSSVKIALFSLGNLAVHSECRGELNSALRAGDLCHALIAVSSPEDVINQYAQRLLRKLSAT
eukprot:TRINITY_DN111616_c0_g1_i1.p1 TRINITY_DN111616_c0_g1~~TRINITY_DN111616_c0_g1_i1.p1  ORF type:complete len:1391 (+),score=295.62 TRINITY_DN111616_c0_g1_i1:196-4368(+)